MTESPRYNPTAHANICLLLEGTYPYVRGGVSTWVKQLIEGMPDLTFSIIFLGAKEGEYEAPAYPIPDNVVHIELRYLLKNTGGMDEKPPMMSRLKNMGKRKDSGRFDLNSQLHTTLAHGEKVLAEEVVEGFTGLLAGSKSISEEELHFSKDSWETIRDKYTDAPAGLDFNHFFWSVRGMHSPLFTIGDVVDEAPAADVYHSVSTGYAGFLGAMLHSKTGKPYIISEHGIYTKERELDIAQVEWIPEELDPFKVGLNEEMSYLRGVWIRFFNSLGRMSYSAAAEVFTLYNGNRKRQIADGCPESKLTIIPNGVNIDVMKAARRPDDAEIPPVLGLIGRVVPIKDIKNFIRAMRVVKEALPNAQGWLIGPQDEDEDYFEECQLLVDSLDLRNTVKFLGFQKPTDMFPKLGLNVLTSVSEGQPLTTLEGYAAGIPAVATNVGSCSELVFGATDEDKELGASGAIVPISNPSLFAEAAIELLTNREKWCKARDAAIKRVETFYDDRDMIRRYHDVYDKYLQAAVAENRKAS